jgi:hypothetical protein
MRAAITYSFAAASHESRSTFFFIEWERQTTDGTVASITAFGLFKQNFVTQLSHPFFACSLVLWPMRFLTLNAAISNGFTGGACLQFYFVDFCDAAGSANVSRLSVFAAHHHFSLYFHSHQANVSCSTAGF